MIVEIDFLDHWKTRLLVRLLGTEAAPIYVLRLWAHCQSRKTDRFTGWEPAVLASVCRWETDPQTLWDAMSKTYLEIDGNTVIARGWAETNASLVSAWANGKLGGRPRKAPVFTQPEPTGNRPVIPSGTDRVSDREEKRREEETEKKKTSSRFAPPTREQAELEAAKVGLPGIEVDKFLSYYGANGWRVGRTPMKSWQHALAGWAARWRSNPGRSYRNEPAPKTPDDAAF